jgi:uncharacterized protein (DUF488 family)
VRRTPVPPEPRTAKTPVVFTIGHSTRPIDEFIGLLRAHGVERVVDVRRLPGSRRNPQYDREQLARSLRRAKIRYRHLPGLGGRRKASPRSRNTAWRNASFRGYADYMETARFRASLAALLAMSVRERVVLMCAEAVPWRCHRSLIADALLVRGVDVRDIASMTSARPHRLTPWARVRGTQITYPETGSQTPARRTGKRSSRSPRRSRRIPGAD